MAPDHLKDDPIRAYGEYSFREGVRLGMSLAVFSLKWGEDSSTAGE